MVPIMIGIKIHKPGKVSLSRGIKKLKKASLKESLRDYRRDVSNKRINQTANWIALQYGGLGGAGDPCRSALKYKKSKPCHL